MNFLAVLAPCTDEKVIVSYVSSFYSTVLKSFVLSCLQSTTNSAGVYHLSFSGFKGMIVTGFDIIFSSHLRIVPDSNFAPQKGSGE